MVGDLVEVLLDALKLGGLDGELGRLLFLLTVRHDATGELLEGMLVRLDDLVVLPQDVVLIIVQAHLDDGSTVLCLQEHADVVAQQVGRMIVAVTFHLFNLALGNGQLLLLPAKFRIILIDVRVEVLEGERVEVDPGQLLVFLLVRADDRHVVVARVPDLVHQAAAPILTRLFDLDVNIIEQYLDTYSHRLILLRANLAGTVRVLHVHDVVTLHYRSQAVVLLRDDELYRCQRDCYLPIR